MARPKRQYSDSDKATALATLDANSGNVARTARELGIPRVTLRDWADGSGTVPEVSEIHRIKKGELSDELEKLAYILAGDLMDESKRADSSLKDTAVALGITIDKMQLLRGKPTEVIDHATDSLDRKLADLATRAGSADISGEPHAPREGGS